MVRNDAVATRGPRVAAGLGITVCALVAGNATLATMVVAGWATDWFSWIGWFGWATVPIIWPLLAAWLWAGVTLARQARAGRDERDGDVPAVVAFVGAAQLTGGGVAASRDWFNVGGAVGIPVSRLAILLPLTAVVIVASTIACCLALARVRQHAEAARAEWWRPVRPGFAVLGGVVAVVFPILWSPFGGMEVTALGQTALTWSIPWGCGLALAAWLDRRPRRASLGAVGASAFANLAVMLTGLLA